MFDPKQLLPIVKRSAPQAQDGKILAALTKLSQAHPNLTAEQALAALQKYLQKNKPKDLGEFLKGSEQ